MGFSIDEYISETRKIKNIPEKGVEQYFQSLYYATFPKMKHDELPKLKICSTYDMNSKVVFFNNEWYLIFDCNLYNYIQLLIYSYFSDDCLENYKSLYYAIKRDYFLSLKNNIRAKFFNKKLKENPFSLPNYSDEYNHIIYNIKYVSFSLLCFHEIVHYSFINELKKQFLSNIIKSAINKTKKEVKEHNQVALLLSDYSIIQEIFCDCKSLYGILFLYSEFKNKINPKDIVDSAILNLIGILVVFEAKDSTESNAVIGNWLRLHTLINFVHILIDMGYLKEDVYNEANDIVEFYCTNIYPNLRKLKLKYRKGDDV